MENKLPQRKPNRLKNYDYSSVGAYFITVCTKNKEKIFWKTNNVGATIGRPPKANYVGIQITISPNKIN